MKLLHLVLALAAARQAAALRTVAWQGEGLSPVTRVVELLKGMSKRVEVDGKKEQELYESYVCWAKTVVDTKTATNAKAQSRVDSLEAYIADLDAGRVELTTERQDLEKEIAGLTSDIETATSLREKEHEDYLAAKEEMDQAIAALTSAVEVLKEGQAQGAGLLSIASKLEGGYRARAADGEALARAVEVGRQVLSRGDALFLQRVLTGDVPVRDWKKLNRKAEFKMGYKARSAKILETLENMLLTFTNTLAETQGKEDKALELHNTLMGNKNGQKSAAEEALSKMELEGAARGLTKTEAQQEIQALDTQIADDKRFITQTEAELETKKEEWTDRKTIRMNELEAISKAIAILQSDDARDLFKKSFSSQGYSLVQLGSSASARAQHHATTHAAAAALAKAARLSKDARLARLASRLAAAAPSHFQAVVDAIDVMIGTLQAEEGGDLQRKEDCEQTRADDTRDAIKYSREMDELTDTIDRLNSEIKELQDEIAEKAEEIVKINETLREAKINREDENVAWMVSDREDGEASALVQQAVDVLTQFYSELALVQKRRREPPTVVAGEAPPPPPTTWDAPYAGKQEENTGVVSILSLIKQDIDKDKETAQTAETNAETAYVTFKAESESERSTLQGDISMLNGQISGKEDDITAAEGDRDGKKGLLQVVMKKLKDEAPGCDFFTINYDVRLKNRQIEIDGLQKAKAILSGAAFGGTE